MNLYLKELEKLNQELSQMTEEEIFELIKDVDLTDCSQYAELENFILNSEVKSETR